jgi:cytochrome c-550 PedF
MQPLAKTGKQILAALLLGWVTSIALAHGDVTPHPVDTTGLKALGKEWVDVNPYRGDPKAVALGAVGYAHNCAGCHGLNAESGGVAPDLLVLNKDCDRITAADKKNACLKDADDYFKTKVLAGKKNGEGRYVMPAYDGIFTQEAVWAVKAYLDARTIEDQQRKK